MATGTGGEVWQEGEIGGCYATKKPDCGGQTKKNDDGGKREDARMRRRRCYKIRICS